MLDKKYLLSTIRDVENFPKDGVSFKDITTLLNDKKAFKMTIEHLKERYQNSKLEYIVGIEARGFMFASALAYALNIGFVPIRKVGKLPFTVVSEKYALEYGIDEVQIHLDAFHNKKHSKVVLIDDLIATGGTANASVNLLHKLNVELVETCFIVDLKFLGGSRKLDSNVYSVLEIGNE